MAERIGLFSSPEEVRDSRLAQIRKLQQENAPKGFNFGVSLGQGMRESANNMLGITNPMEAKAAELQAMMQSVAPDDIEGLANIARMMNELGYTKEAIAVMQQRDSVVKAELERKKEEESLGRRNVMKKVTKMVQNPADPFGPPVPVETSIQVTQVKDANGNWVDLEVTPQTKATGMPLPEESPVIKGGTAADYVKEKGWVTN
jgi:hypothetical protein